MSTRIAIAAVGQETCTFSPLRTTLDDFRQRGLYEGEEIIEKTRGVGTMGGFLEAMEENGGDIQPLPIINAWAGASGLITEDTLEYFRQKLVSGLRAMGPIDGMFFSLHGAASAVEHPDLEGYLLTAVREVIGDDVPLVTPLDHHANITRQMMSRVDGLVGYRTQPHDQFDTGKAAAKLLLSIIRKEVRPTIAWQKIPMITHQEQFLTKSGPMKQWFDQARAFERRPGVISVSNFPMQPWLDVPEGGWTTVVITDNDMALAEKLAAESANLAWSLREEFMKMDSVPPSEAIRLAEAADRGLVVISDTGDSVFGGSSGDSTILLKEMIDQKIQSVALVPMMDPEVALAAFEAGAGSEITVKLGGKFATEFFQPIEVTARVAGTATGRFDARVSQMSSIDMGRTALLEIGENIKVVVSEFRGIGGNHPAVYRRFGIDPAQAKMVVLKTASNFQYYADMTSQLIRADTRGPTMSHITEFNWTATPRPFWPLDDLPEWNA